MRYVEAGGARMSVIGLGTWQFGGSDWGYGSEYQTKTAPELVTRALDLGVNLFDTAEAYGFGKSERVLGAALAERRDEAFIATKHLPLMPLPTIVERRGRASAKRLGIDQIDLYQLHWPNPVVPDSSSMSGMRRLLDAGVVKHAGVSNYTTSRWEKAEAELGAPVLSNQVAFNLLTYGPKERSVPYAKSNDRIVIAYSPLAQGVLSGKYDADNRPAGRARRINPAFIPENLNRMQPLLDALREIANSHQTKPAQIALAWVLAHDNVVAIPGAASVEQLEGNVAASEISLTASEKEQLDTESAAFKPVSAVSGAVGLARNLIGR